MDTDTQTETTKLSPTVDVPNYSFIDDDELQKDFMSGAKLSQTNIPAKVYFYLYSIITPANTPYLKVFLSGGGEAAAGNAALDLPSADITPADVLGGGADADAAAPLDLNEAFLNECMEKLTTDILKDHELATSYKEHYKGFVMHDDKIVIVFQLPGAAASAAAAVADATPALIDEIVNKKQVDRAPVHDNVRKFLYSNLKCLYITSEDFENYEIPQVFYGEAALTRKLSDYGFFYKLSPVPTETMTKKYVCFVENGLFCAAAAGAQPTPDAINKEFDASIIIEPATTEGLWHFKSFGQIFEYV